MLDSILRSFIVYCLLIVSVRVMGKREIGQLQPSELVITLLISEIAATPIENRNIPFSHSIAVIVFLVGVEVSMSLLTLKFSKLRHIVQGNSLLVINNGRIVQRALKKMRLTVDDLIEGLRIKDVFDVGEVEYAYVETNGQLSVKLKEEKEPVTAEDMNISTDKGGIPFVLISDGRMISESLDQCGLTAADLENILKNNDLRRKDVLILAADKNGVTYLVKKEKSKAEPGDR